MKDFFSDVTGDHLKSTIHASVDAALGVLPKAKEGEILRKCPIDVWLSLSNFWESVQRKSSETGLPILQVVEPVAAEHDLPSNVIESIKSCVSVRQEQLESWRKSFLLNSSEHRLQDFFWNVSLVLSSDKFSQLREPMCQLNLVLDEQHQKPTLLELNKEELRQFLSTLNQAIEHSRPV